MSNIEIFRWGTFLCRWSREFYSLKQIIKLISLYPERLDLIGLGNLLQYNEMDTSQREWVWLYSRFENEIERRYFKPYHVPINSDDFKIFVDLSKKEMPLFEPVYNFRDQCWTHLTRFESILELVQFLDSDSDIPVVIDKKLSEHLTSLLDDLPTIWL